MKVGHYDTGPLPLHGNTNRCVAAGMVCGIVSLLVHPSRTTSAACRSVAGIMVRARPSMSPDHSTHTGHAIHASRTAAVRGGKHMSKRSQDVLQGKQGARMRGSL